MWHYSAECILLAIDYTLLSYTDHPQNCYDCASFRAQIVTIGESPPF